LGFPTMEPKISLQYSQNIPIGPYSGACESTNPITLCLIKITVKANNKFR